MQTMYSGHVVMIHPTSGRRYYVNNNQSMIEKQKKVETLEYLRIRMNRLLDALRQRMEYRNHIGVQRLLQRHRKQEIQLDELENSRYLLNVFAFNVNKGERISICLQGECRANECERNSRNELMFVMMHELAHSMTEEYDHSARFWRHFRLLIHVAIEEGLYTNIDYGKRPKRFCKHHVDHNPMFD
jgi:hypothetical protein